MGPLGRRRGTRGGARPLRRVCAAEGPLRALRLHAGGDRRTRQEGGEGMSVQETGVNQRLAALTAAGTSVWLDQIRRNLIESGELERLVREDSLRGVTSNPSIFEKAILGSDDYDDEIRAAAEEGLSAKEIYEKIAVKDVQLAADVLRPVWDESDGH